MTHWAVQYIGEPWVARDHDCWAFARRVWREQFGRDVPAVDVDACNRIACVRAFATHEERTHWHNVAEPQEGDAVLLSQSKHPSHVGVWIDADGGGVLHCVEGFGVVFQTVASMRAAGWHGMEFYRNKCTL
jgi:cell wall-associated NlpC family hydrolase